MHRFMLELVKKNRENITNQGDHCISGGTIKDIGKQKGGRVPGRWGRGEGMLFQKTKRKTNTTNTYLGFQSSSLIEFWISGRTKPTMLSRAMVAIEETQREAEIGTFKESSSS